MITTSRRSVLTVLAAAGLGTALPATLGAAPASAATDLYSSNTDLYQKLAGREGIDFARRYQRHAYIDNDQATRPGSYARTAILALHGGGIEVGTSELCLGIAGYTPKDLTPHYGTGAPLHDYWMFEGMRTSGGNSELHVTSTHCDDRVALSLAAGALNAVSVHGCTAAQAGAPASRPEAVVIGGLNSVLRQYLGEALRAAGVQTIEGSADGDIDGVHPSNICNRTLLGMGAQLELTTELRVSMFGTNTLKGRAGSVNAEFWKFTDAVRAAVARMEADPSQAVL
ncbi:poly-gamma-glutamate hydrolase family protein [Streptomyces sp. 840.1]|uniref:poly-gamma-glutamate hydrolase family protein n=1 Tax=Streptomyces sp. 840.1 TaxID=2485152 RepID=UPI000F48D629|nr:poly-gamma-glutamate hydrolase family protein [Streptomyces sp. 840.1]